MLPVLTVLRELSVVAEELLCACLSVFGDLFDRGLSNVPEFVVIRLTMTIHSLGCMSTIFITITGIN